MNIQSADRLRLPGGMHQLQNDRLMQIIAVHFDLDHHRQYLFFFLVVSRDNTSSDYDCLAVARLSTVSLSLSSLSLELACVCKRKPTSCSLASYAILKKS